MLNFRSLFFVLAMSPLPLLAQETMAPPSPYLKHYSSDDHYRSNAFDESYRRGYDDGFAAGYDRARREVSLPVVVQPTPIARPNGPIRVLSAFYGTASHSCNATHHIERSANGRRSISIAVTNKLCGDPHPGKKKELTVEYRCGDFHKTSSAPEHRDVYLNCN